MHYIGIGIPSHPLDEAYRMKQFNGKILFLDRADINTDEIIPAKYLIEISKEALQPHLLEDLKLSGFDPSKDIKGKGIIVTRSNFGCGSSREHAPWALEVNGINLVIAEGFARIFRQNMFNCGMMAIELEHEYIDRLFNEFSGHQTAIETDLVNSRFTVTSGKARAQFPFSISAFNRSLVEAGGWVEYADQKY
jgi:3-isopropylmalate/(R)-2-methylmalate dehydratase small subunit